MKILVTGANGFLGYYLVKQLLQENHTVIATGKGENRLPFKTGNFLYEEMDFTDPYAVHDVFEKHGPDIVVHSGAMGKPDDCELNQMLAYLVNVEGTVHLLTNAEEKKSFFIFLSTDFVFSGEKGMYSESDAARPVNYYGRTKLEAEEAVQDYPYGWAIVRTVLVYGPNHAGRHNLVSLVKEKLEKGEHYSVVNDQQRTPTYVEDLARAIVSIIDKKATGIWHISGNDLLTPYDMAVKTAEHLGLDAGLIRKTSSAELGQAAKRPPKTGFNIEKARKNLGYDPLSFEEGLKRMLGNMNK